MTSRGSYLRASRGEETEDVPRTRSKRNPDCELKKHFIHYARSTTAYVLPTPKRALSITSPSTSALSLGSLRLGLRGIRIRRCIRGCSPFRRNVEGDISAKRRGPGRGEERAGIDASGDVPSSRVALVQVWTRLARAAGSMCCRYATR